MQRRELLKLISLATGSAIIGGEFLLTGCNNPNAQSGIIFSDADIKFLDEIAETILPKTKTPGAKDAAVGKLMALIVQDCYESKDQNIFRDGIKKLDEACNKSFQNSFLKTKKENRVALLTDLDKESKLYNKSKSKDEANHYFTMMKQLTLFGYFTSKPALTEAFNYQSVPGKYDGAFPYKKGDKLFI